MSGGGDIMLFTLKEKLLLVGAGGFGRVVSETAGLKYESAFVDDNF